MLGKHTVNWGCPPAGQARDQWCTMGWPATPLAPLCKKMRRTLLFTLSLAGLISFLPAPAKAQWAMTCTRDPNSSVNLRRGPGLNHSIIASIPNQSTVRIMSWVWGADNMRWYRLESSGIVGFARSDYLCK